ncbi:hypothetical protein [Paraburkholderia silvatlantica]|uniref:hypothetical protein n=1 Tax=Paraburkholderia silvatlantica TaxID=321895 RepID=UPI003750B617
MYAISALQFAHVFLAPSTILSAFKWTFVHSRRRNAQDAAVRSTATRYSTSCSRRRKLPGMGQQGFGASSSARRLAMSSSQAVRRAAVSCDGSRAAACFGGSDRDRGNHAANLQALLMDPVYPLK